MESATLSRILQQVKDPPALHRGEIAVDYSALIKRYLPANCHVICDINTHRNLPFPTLCFDAPPKAEMPVVEHIRHVAAQAEALVALGSGTINDLVKYAAFLDKKPYLVIATAPSMNGYVSANASISEHGHKHSLPARGPVAVLADLPTLTKAPLPLIQAGIGDTLCRSTVQADWLLSHLLRGTPYEPMYFEWIRPYEENLLSSLRAQRPEGRRKPTNSERPGWIASALPRNDELIKCLFEALIVSGLAMRHHGSSMPASQGEHMIAHTREMLFPDLPSHFHGLEIAVTTLTIARIQDKLLHLSHRERSASACEQGEGVPRPHPKAALHLSTSPSGRGVTESIRQKIEAIRLPTAQLEAALTAAGCPTTPAQLGWPEAEYAQCIAKAHTLRDRFTFLNLYNS